MKIANSLTGNVLTAILCFIAAGAANSEPPELIPPSPNEIFGLDAPGFQNEGLHRMRVTVKADGSVDDARVVGGFTDPIVKDFLVQAVKRWTFNPGTVNGEPQDFYNQEYVIRYRITGSPPISNDVSEKLNEVNGHLTENNYEKALKEVNKLIKNKLVTALDYVITHDILASIHIAMNNPFEALEASQIATMSRVNSEGNTEFILPPEMLDLALRKRFLLANSLHQAAEAMRTFEILEQAFEIQEDDPIRKQAEALRSALESPEPLMSSAKIVGKQWSYEPARRVVTVANLEGELKKINVRCQRGNIELEYQDNVEWNLPEKLGQCTLDFVGDEGTKFNFYEFAG